MKTLLLLVLGAAVPAGAAGGRTPEDFAFDLYRNVAAANAGKNVFVSPSSARWALGMAYAGAAGETGAEMGAALGLGPLEEAMRAESARTAALLSADPKVKLKIANSVWLKKGFPFRKEYVSDVRSAYKAEVFERDFTQADANEANAWVSKQTEGRIPSIISKFGPLDRGVLLNAVYFKGNWSAPFDKAATRTEDFHAAGGRTVKSRLMSKAGKYDYLEGKDFQAVRLPYGSRRLGMIILLPGKGLELARFEARLGASFWREVRSGLRERGGRVRLPSFKLEFTAPLIAPLKAMGIASAFDPGSADFTRMARAPRPIDRLYITSVLQKTFVEVNEEGTEAAAATAVTMGVRGAARTEPPFDFRADRPFLYAIEDSQTGEILFLGALQEPK